MDDKNVKADRQPYWKDPKPSYMMVGAGQNTRMFPEGGVDALRLIGSLNKSQLEIFLYFRDLIVIRNQLEKKYPKPSRNLNEISLQGTGYEDLKRLMQRNNNIKTLTDLGIVKKGKKKRYMVNPFILIPSRNFKWHAATWMYYKFIDESNGQDLDSILISMNMTLDESMKYMKHDI